MFTGLIERTGTITAIEKIDGQMTAYEIDVGENFDAEYGDSIAINGTCLTVCKMAKSIYRFELNAETLAVSSLGKLSVSDTVNLERAMTLSHRLGGHLVSGHIDGTATITSIDHKPEGSTYQIKLSKELSRYVIHKGSLCIDGVSLTVNSLRDEGDHSFVEVMLIPTTLEKTAFLKAKTGQTVNIEVDMLAKYIERFQVVDPK